MRLAVTLSLALHSAVRPTTPKIFGRAGEGSPLQHVTDMMAWSRYATAHASALWDETMSDAQAAEDHQDGEGQWSGTGTMGWRMPFGLWQIC